MKPLARLVFRTLASTAVVFLVLATSRGFALAQPKDYPGSKDHPMIKRYPGSTIEGYRVKEFDEYVLPLGKLVRRENTVVLEKTEQLEGKVTHIEYKTPKERSMLEIFRNYEMALKRPASKPCSLAAIRREHAARVEVAEGLRLKPGWAIMEQDGKAGTSPPSSSALRGGMSMWR